MNFSTLYRFDVTARWWWRCDHATLCIKYKLRLHCFDSVCVCVYIDRSRTVDVELWRRIKVAMQNIYIFHITINRINNSSRHRRRNRRHHNDRREKNMEWNETKSKQKTFFLFNDPKIWIPHTRDKYINIVYSEIYRCKQTSTNDDKFHRIDIGSFGFVRKNRHSHSRQMRL